MCVRLAVGATIPTTVLHAVVRGDFEQLLLSMVLQKGVLPIQRCQHLSRHAPACVPHAPCIYGIKVVRLTVLINKICSVYP